MISHELSTILQHNQVQEWLQSCPGYVVPDLEGLNSTFRAEYLPAHKVSKTSRRKQPTQNHERAAQEAELAKQIKALADQDKGVTAIGVALRMDGRRVHVLAKKYGITIPDKSVFRKEAI